MKRRILALAICALLLCPAAMAKTLVMECYGSGEENGYTLLIKEDGTPLTEPNEYRSIYEITPAGTPEAERLFSATAGGGEVLDAETAAKIVEESDEYSRAALMDAEGRRLTGFDYYYFNYKGGALEYYAPDIVGAGLMDLRGNVIVGGGYIDLQPMGEGRWLALRLPEGTEPGNEYAADSVYTLEIIDAGGATRPLDLHSTSAYLPGNDQSEGPWAVEDIVEWDGTSGYIDDEGCRVFEATFDSAESFHGKCAVIDVDNQEGLIDREGSPVTQIEFNYIAYDEPGVFVCRHNSHVALVNAEDGSILLDRDFSPSEEADITVLCKGAVLLQDGKQSWVADFEGNTLFSVPEDADFDYYFGKNGEITRLVERTGEWPFERYRLTDLTGKPVGGDFQSIQAQLWQDGRGRFIVSEYPVRMDQDGDYVPDWGHMRYGLIDDEGNELLPTVYDTLTELGFDRFWAVAADRRGMIDAEGNWYYSISDYAGLMD